jgi:hypothetical protein
MKAWFRPSSSVFVLVMLRGSPRPGATPGRGRRQSRVQTIYVPETNASKGLLWELTGPGWTRLLAGAYAEFRPEVAKHVFRPASNG